MGRSRPHHRHARRRFPDEENLPRGDPSGKLREPSATVATLAPSKELRQTGGVPGLLTFDHQWLLKPVDGGTKVTQHEVDRGLGLWFWNSDWIEPSYAKTLEALKERVESK